MYHICHEPYLIRPSFGKTNRHPPSQAARPRPTPSGKRLRAVPRLRKPGMLLHAPPTTSSTRSLPQTRLRAQGTAGLPVRSRWFPPGAQKAPGQLQEIPRDHRPVDRTLDSTRSHRVLQPTVSYPDQRKRPRPNPSPTIKANMSRSKRPDRKTPTELPCAPQTAGPQTAGRARFSSVFPLHNRLDARPSLF